jgi:hypothetical protein
MLILNARKVSLPKVYKSSWESNAEGGEGSSGTCKSSINGYYHHYCFYCFLLLFWLDCKENEGNILILYCYSSAKLDLDF